MDMINVKGIDRDGESRSVSFAASPAGLAADLAGSGWRYARLTDDSGYMVGEVFLDPQRLRRTWWAAQEKP